MSLRVLTDAGVLRGVGLDDLLPAVGQYVPGPTTTGPKWATTYAQVYPSTPDGPISITTPGVHEGSEYWGRVVPQVSGIIFRNCIFRGADPEVVTQGRSCIQSSGTNPPHWEAYDCRIDPSGWPNFGAAQQSRGNCYINGISGYNYKIERVEITNVNDGIQFVGPIGSLEIAQAASTEILGCWIHKGYYMNPFPDFSDQQPHADAFQFMTGKNLTIRGCMLGGVRAPAGYTVWPGGTNQGDDFWNSIFMMMQEVGADAMLKIENVIVEDNYIAGGIACFNWAYSADRPNQWESCIVRRNKLMTRAYNWGNLSPGQPTTTGIYGNLTQGQFLGQAYDNVIWETGAPAPGMNK